MTRIDAVAINAAHWLTYLSQHQPCFYACGVLLPKDCTPESTALRRAHLEVCPNAKPIVKRAAALIQQNHVQTKETV